MIVRVLTPRDAPAWLRMRRALWPHHAESEHAAEITAFLDGRAREPLAVLVAADGADQLIGFAELSIRAYAECFHRTPHLVNRRRSPRRWRSSRASTERSGISGLNRVPSLSNGTLRN